MFSKCKTFEIIDLKSRIMNLVKTNVFNIEHFHYGFFNTQKKVFIIFEWNLERKRDFYLLPS